MTSESNGESGRFLVTGGCGFIGSALCRLLAERGMDLVVLDNLSTGDPALLPPATELVSGDICDRRALDRALRGVQGVFHLAAISSVEICTNHRAEASRTNLQGTVTLLEATGDLPFVFTSSAAIYGEQAVQPVSEAAVPEPISSYAIDKLGSEQHIREAAALRGARGVVLRPFNVFGEMQNGASPYSGVLSRFVSGARAGAPLRVDGDGSQTRDFIHVDQVATALAAAMDLALASRPGTFRTINACTGSAISILELARMVNARAGSRTPISFGAPRLGDIHHSTGDPSVAGEVLGFRAETGLERCIDEMLATPPRVSSRTDAAGM